MLANWFSRIQTIADLDLDGIVNSFDYRYLIKNWGRGSNIFRDNGSAGGLSATINLASGEGSATLPSGIFIEARGTGGKLTITELASPSLPGLPTSAQAAILGLHQLTLAYNGPSQSLDIRLVALGALATGDIHPNSLFFIEPIGNRWGLLRNSQGDFVEQMPGPGDKGVATVFFSRQIGSAGHIIKNRIVLVGIHDEFFSLSPEELGLHRVD